MNLSETDRSKDKKSALTEEEETTLFKQIDEGKKAARLLRKGNLSENEKIHLSQAIERAAEARKRIFTEHLFLIDEVKYNYCYNPLYWLEDVEQDAAIKLMECIDKYDLNNPASFSTYARKCIMGSVIDSLAENTSLIHKKKSFVKRVWQLNRFKSDFFRDQGYEPSNQEILDNMGIGKNALKNISRYNYLVFSYNASPKGQSDDDSSDMEDKVSGRDSEYSDMSHPDQTDQAFYETTDCLKKGSVIYEQVQAQLAEVIDENCTEQEKMILDYRFGFYGEPMTDAQIAEKLNMDVNEVQLIWARVLLNLEEPCKKKGLHMILD